MSSRDLPRAHRPFSSDGYMPLWLILVRMEGAVAGVALGPDQQQQVFALRALVYCAGKLACRRGRFAVDFHDHVAGLKAGIVGRAGRAHALDDNAVKLIGRVDLLALVGS